MKKENAPIFIHSLFRTGSTYIWNKFRQDDRYFCYYEPFHQNFIFLNVENSDLWNFDSNVTERIHHPRLEKSYTYEYRDLLPPVRMPLPLFKKSFSFDEYCNNSKNPDAKKYIDSLIDNAKKKYKIPVLQFNRSSLRIRWFKENYPDSVHLYLARHPRDQFQSYIEMFEKNDLDIFLVMDLIVAGKNRDSQFFKILDSQIPLVDYHNDLFKNEYLIYGKLVNNYSNTEKYYLFYYIWLYSLVENELNADLILNINLLSYDSNYREKIYRYFDKNKIIKVDFNDAKIRRYEAYCLEEKKMAEIEQDVQARIFVQIGKDKDRFFSKLSNEDREFFKFKIDTESVESFHINTGTNKYKIFFNSLADDFIAQHNFLQELQKEIKRKNNGILLHTKEVEQKVKQLERLKQRIELKDKQIIQKDQRLEQKDRQLEKKEQALARKVEVLENIKQRLNEKDLLIKEKDNQLKQKDQQLEKKNQDTARQAEVLENIKQRLNEKDLLIKEKDNQLKQKDQQLEKKNREIVRPVELLEETVRKLNEKDSLIKEKDNQLKQKDQQLEKKNQEIVRPVELLEETVRKINEKDLLIREKDNQLKQKDQHLHQKDQLLMEKVHQLDQKTLDLKQVDRHLKQKENHIKKILNSKSYRVGRSILFPFILVKRIIKKIT